VPSCAEASSRRNAHFGVGIRNIQVAPAGWATHRLAYCLGSPSGDFHVHQTYQQVPHTAHPRRTRRKVPYCNPTQRNTRLIALSFAAMPLHCWRLANLCCFIFGKQGWMFVIVGPITKEDTVDYRELTKRIFTWRSSQQILFACSN